MITPIESTFSVISLFISFFINIHHRTTSINNKNRDDKYQFENHRIDTYFIIDISLSTIYYLKIEDYKENSAGYVYCGSIIKMKLINSVGLLEKFAL